MIEIRPVSPEERELVIGYSEEFYRSDAVSHPIPRNHFEKTIDLCLAGSPYVCCYLFLYEGKPAGYAQISLTYSNEAGGMCIWVEEVFTLEAFRGKGLGKAFFDRLDQDFPHAARFRLEITEDNEGAARLYRRMGYEDFPYKQMTRDLPQK